ncbi:MAG: chromosomal replication initiator protein DnaA [Candidatus Bipolaricaulota bacterium]|nr:chromosomal replication initiator protein DnaA [Candidatus Bipolaricaulota bacterium]
MGDSSIMVWDSVLSGLRTQIPPTSFETWFSDAQALDYTDGALVIGVPDSFKKGGIERRYRDTIEGIATSVCQQPVSLEVRVLSMRPDGATALEKGEPPAFPTVGGSLPLNPDYTFGAFVRGENNRLAVAASEATADAVARNLKKPYNPLFIYGSVGLGKTHLLHAIGNAVREMDSARSVVYTTSERFAIELINAIRNNSTAAFRDKYRQVDLLLIDDVQFLKGKEATQEELFHTFNDLHGNRKQIVLSSDRPPEDLSGLQDRLVSRFKWGLEADIQPPDFETRMAILREKATTRGLEVNHDVLELIAKRISSNVRALEGALVKAIAYAELQGQPLTPKSIEGVLPKEGRRPRLTVAHIKEEVALHYQIPLPELDGASRKKEITQARQVAIYLARELTELSFPSIGREFGDRDHTTIMHAYSKIKLLLADTPLLSADIGDLQEGLESRYSLIR